MEGLESFAGIMARPATADENDGNEANYSFDKQGRRYLSAMPAR